MGAAGGGGDEAAATAESKEVEEGRDVRVVIVFVDAFDIGCPGLGVDVLSPSSGGTTSADEPSNGVRNELRPSMLPIGSSSRRSLVASGVGRRARWAKEVREGSEKKALMVGGEGSGWDGSRCTKWA
jgi:hypothetical protein